MQLFLMIFIIIFFQQYIFAKLENLKSEMDEIVKEMKIETNYGIHKYNWSKEYARRLYNHSVGNVLSLV